MKFSKILILSGLLMLSCNPLLAETTEGTLPNSVKNENIIDSEKPRPTRKPRFSTPHILKRIKNNRIKRKYENKEISEEQYLTYKKTGIYIEAGTCSTDNQKQNSSNQNESENIDK